MSHFLYRHFGENGDLLYIGISNNSLQRLDGHRRSGWASKIKIVTVDSYPSKKEAAKAEKLAIIREKPIFNKKYNEPPKLKKQAALKREKPIKEKIVFLIPQHIYDWMKKRGDEFGLRPDAIARMAISEKINFIQG